MATLPLLSQGAHVSGSAVVLRGRPSAVAVVRAGSSVNSIDVSDVRDFEIDVCVTLEAAQLPRRVTLAAVVVLTSDPRWELGVGNSCLSSQPILVPLDPQKMLKVKIPTFFYATTRCEFVSVDGETTERATRQVDLVQGENKCHTSIKVKEAPTFPNIFVVKF